jgi:ATP sulfurylase
LQGRECSEVFLLQQNSVVIRSSRPHNGTLWNVPLSVPVTQA